MKLGELIKKYRDEQNISQRAFADKCGISHGTISIIEKGINPQTGKVPSITFETYEAVAKAMNISVNDLFAELDEGIQIPWGLSDKKRALMDAVADLSEKDIDIALALVRRLKGEE